MNLNIFHLIAPPFVSGYVYSVNETSKEHTNVIDPKYSFYI